MQPFCLVIVYFSFAFIYTTVANVIPINTTPKSKNAIVIPDCDEYLGPVPEAQSILSEIRDEAVNRLNIRLKMAPEQIALSEISTIRASGTILKVDKGMSNSFGTGLPISWHSSLVPSPTVSVEPEAPRNPVLQRWYTYGSEDLDLMGWATPLSTRSWEGLGRRSLQSLTTMGVWDSKIRKNGFNPSCPLRPPPFLLAIRNPTFPEPTPPPPAFLKDNSMCVFLGAALGICNSLTPGFTTLNPTVQAHCLCYSSAVWAPGIFDGAVGQCAGFASTAVPDAYPPLANLGGFCEIIGDVEGPKSTSVTTTTYTKVVASQINPGCAAVTGALVACMGKTAGFEDMEPTEQAKCFCYDSSTSWVPTQFDNAASTCAEYTKAADSAYSTFYPGVTPLVGLCASAGNVLSTSIPTPTSTSMATSSSPSLVSNTSGAISTESDTTRDTTITIRATMTPVPVESNKGSIRKVKQTEVIGISFCCAVLLLFLW